MGSTRVDVVVGGGLLGVEGGGGVGSTRVDVCGGGVGSTKVDVWLWNLLE